MSFLNSNVQSSFTQVHVRGVEGDVKLPPSVSEDVEPHEYQSRKI